MLLPRQALPGDLLQPPRPLLQILGYEEAWLENVPESAIEPADGTGNPFSLGTLQSGENVVDIGCGAGIDSFIAANMVGPEGQVVGVDMTPAMLNRAKASLAEINLQNISFRAGYGEALPVAGCINKLSLNLRRDHQLIF